MQTLKIVALAILQGVAEFLPVSSSGHLAIAQRCFGVNAPGNAIEVILHFGTLLAVVWFYRARLALLAIGVLRGSHDARRYAVSLLVGCVPAAAAYVLFDDFFEECFARGLAFTGAMLLVTGFVLLSTRFARARARSGIVPWRAALVGLAQAAALLPGISRSGSTMATARHLGVDPREAADFSFLMTVPLLAGACAVAPLSGKCHLAEIGYGTSLLAVAVSCATGYFALRGLIRILGGGKLWLFGIYCLAAGIAAIVLG